MALTQQLAYATVNAQAGAVTALLNNAYLRIYDGAQPADADTAISGNNLLAELRLGNPAFGAAVNGAATANAIAGVTAAATGTASWFRLLATDGSTVIMDGSAGTSGCNLNLNSVAIECGAAVSIASFTFTASKS
jgi:hypothetical protein